MTVLLIGGSSHVGKSTLAQRLADRLSCACLCTDFLARHPGRPWRTPPDVVPPHVADYYLNLGVEEQMASVLAHYRALRPRIEAMIAKPETKSLVLEGSAVLPEILPPGPGVSGVWLTASEDLLAERIRRDSGYVAGDVTQRRMIDAFVTRTVVFNRLILEEVSRRDLPHIRVERDLAIDELAGIALSVAKTTR